MSWMNLKMNQRCRVTKIELSDQNRLEIFPDKPLHLSSIIDKSTDTANPATIIQSASCNLLKDWKPPFLPPHAVHHLTERRVYCGEVKKPTKVVKIPVEISVFGEKIRGIIDSDSERSFLSESAYNRIKDFQVQTLTPNTSSEMGVRLGDRSVVKTLGGTGFIIDIDDVYGPQWFSALPELSGDLILGMDFWLTFKVIIDSFFRTWNLAGSGYTFPLSRRFILPVKLQILTVNQAQRLKEFLDV
ncbi:hypothetical protein RF55_13676 [Lasius niger]|uniref:Uncharacterized protein n=1 Tax=Lasius niger TaxID=67767 RepID=A0A0J7KA00_LASNI|nr:hypothetical protein RF55_13676 [Lasius niger]